MVIPAVAMPPMFPITVCTTLPQTEKMAVIMSMAEPTATFASRKRIKCRNTNSGRWKSRKETADWKIPIAKKRTSRP